jgi:cysteinyl-tRNA synthetase
MLKVTNTLTGKKETFEPLISDHIKMYVCGPTVYDDIHIGNARSAVNFDTIRKYLVYSGFAVKYVMNITDIDDKIIKKAIDEKKDFHEIAGAYTQAYFEVMKKLGVLPPDVQPKATDSIREMIELISGLITSGHAYVSGGDVLYDSKSFQAYGKLSGKNLEELIEGIRVEKNDTKKNPTDFVLWKTAKPGEPSWDSPWGKGRPGWHIECSAMVRKHLGDSIDIHGGGVDLIFPHHENEIAQCEAFTQKPYVKYWLHNGFIEISGQKMSKSLGNVWKAKDALVKFRPEVLRYFFLSAHYRSGLNYDIETLESCRRGLEEFNNTFVRAEQVLQLKSRPDYPMNLLELRMDFEQVRNKFNESMDDDFNTPKALAVLFDFAKSVRKFLSDHVYITDAGKNILQESLSLLSELAGLLAIINTKENDESEIEITNQAKFLANVRSKLKLEKKYQDADSVRNQILNLGFVVEDVKDGEPRLVPLKDDQKYEMVKNLFSDEYLNIVFNAPNSIVVVNIPSHQAYEVSKEIMLKLENEAWKTFKFLDISFFVNEVIRDFVTHRMKNQ